MANGRPPWAAYRVLMSGRLVGLGKCPGIQTVGVGDMWKRIRADSDNSVFQRVLQYGATLRGVVGRY